MPLYPHTFKHWMKPLLRRRHAPNQPAPAPESTDRRRLFLTAVLSSGLLTGLYWTVPPIFANADAEARNAASGRGIAISSLPNRSTDLPSATTPALQTQRRLMEALEVGVGRLERVAGYTANFYKYEVVGGTVGAPQTMAIKLRHAPFSVYMKWTQGNPGRELLYVDGEHNGEMVVQAGGWKGRVLGPLSIDPFGSIALSDARHPVTEAGVKTLCTKLLSYLYADAARGHGFSCETTTGAFGGRPCDVFTTVYESCDVQPDYRKSVVHVDREWGFAVKVQNFGWPGEPMPANRLDAETLLEEYAYSDLNFTPQLAAADFDAGNGRYKLCRR